jgi:serine/threonine-protein kinase
VLHRDLKPANLLLDDDRQVKVSDFGLACKLADVANAPPWGYIEHLPPESVVRGGIDSAVGDVYALGVTLYRLLNGDEMMRSAMPPDGDPTPLIVAGKYPNRGAWRLHVHDSLRRVVRKALHPDPARRYPSASALRHALEGVRPLVSWAQDKDEMSWTGINPSSGVLWDARVVRDGRGRWGFASERGRADKRRRVGADHLSGASRKDAIAHGMAVLDRVATKAR